LTVKAISVVLVSARGGASGDNKERMREHGLGDPAAPEGPALHLVLIQAG
jgi:hypothetical protein